MKHVTVAWLAALALGAGLSPAAAQNAEGDYPATVFCEASGGAPALQENLTVAVSGGRGRYEVLLGGVREIGSGVVSGRRLTLSGRGAGYEIRYVGEVSGTGGILTGRRTGRPGGGRSCQMILGSGR